jgi:hypothetical protein
VSAGYSYATISAARDEPTLISVAFHLDDQAWFAVCGDRDKRQVHLTVSYGDVSATFAPAVPGEVTERDVRIARTLAEKAAEYAAEVERLSIGAGVSAA